jgi:hypothetical protein
MSKHFQTFNSKIVERDTPSKQIHDRSSSWLGTGYSHKKWQYFKCVKTVVCEERERDKTIKSAIRKYPPF